MIVLLIRGKQCCSQNTAQFSGGIFKADHIHTLLQTSFHAGGRPAFTLNAGGEQAIIIHTYEAVSHQHRCTTDWYQWTSLGDVPIYNPQSLNINTLNALHAGLRQALLMH